MSDSPMLVRLPGLSDSKVRSADQMQEAMNVGYQDGALSTGGGRDLWGL
jgi:hypothetical protein